MPWESKKYIGKWKRECSQARYNKIRPTALLYPIEWSKKGRSPLAGVLGRNDEYSVEWIVSYVSCMCSSGEIQVEPSINLICNGHTIWRLSAAEYKVNARCFRKSGDVPWNKTRDIVSRFGQAALQTFRLAISSEKVWIRSVEKGKNGCNQVREGIWGARIKSLKRMLRMTHAENDF